MPRASPSIEQRRAERPGCRDAAVLLRWPVRAGPRGRRPGGRRLPDVARHDARDRGDHRRHARARRAARAHPAVRLPHPHRRPRDREPKREPRPTACCRDSTRPRARRSATVRSTRHSAGVSRQAELRDTSDDDGYIEEHLWTGIARARSGCGAAIVGDPDQVVANCALHGPRHRRVHPLRLPASRRVRPRREVRAAESLTTTTVLLLSHPIRSNDHSKWSSFGLFAG